MAAADEDFDRELSAQVAERLALMEDPHYEYPKALGKIDWILITVCPILCLILLVIGEFV